MNTMLLLLNIMLFYTFLDQTVDDFETIDLPVLGLTNQVGQLLRDIAAVSQHTLTVNFLTIATSFL